jgi:outer membrane protein assembly factor BamB
MWTKATQPGGQPGGEIPSDSEGQFTSTSILNRHWEPIILNGMLFYQHYPQPSNPRADQTWVAVDIRTGETLWERSRGDTGSETLRGGTIQKFHTIQEYGSFAYLWATGSGGMAYCYDPFTGALMAEIEGANWGSAIVDNHPDSYTQAGSLLRYYSSGGNLVMWNSSKMGFDNDVSGSRDWDDGIEWAIDWDDYPTGTPRSVRVTSNEIILLLDVPTYLGGFSYESIGYTTSAAVNARTGALLWGPITHQVPELHDVSVLAARDGAYVLHDKDLNELYCYSTENGQKLWGPVALPYSPWAAMEADTEVYGDYVIHWDFGGNVIGLDKKNGTILWTWTRGSSEMVTPYGVYPLWGFGSHSIADGKIFLSEGSMYDVPLHPAKRIVLDVATGEEVWSILSYSGRAPGAIADGYMLEWNSFSGEIICFGMGPTATTVSANPSVSVEGSSVLIQGMVTDVSPGTEVYNREARFPQGVPAISDKDQAKWMEYVYMQQPKPTDAVGVEVTLTVLDPNGNVYDVATATSDVDGFFKSSFIPQVPGEYTITASFAGSESYWPSDSKTAINVEQAPEATPGPTPTPASMTDTYLIGLTIAILAGIAIAVFLIFCKK